MTVDRSTPADPGGRDNAAADGGRGATVLRLMRRWPVASAVVLTAITVGLLILAAVLGDRALTIAAT